MSARDESGEYSEGRGPRRVDPAGRPLPKSASQRAAELRREGLSERGGARPKQR